MGCIRYYLVLPKMDGYECKRLRFSNCWECLPSSRFSFCCEVWVLRIMCILRKSEFLFYFILFSRVLLFTPSFLFGFHFLFLTFFSLLCRTFILSFLLGFLSISVAHWIIVVFILSVSFSPFLFFSSFFHIPNKNNVFFLFQWLCCQSHFWSSGDLCDEYVWISFLLLPNPRIYS